MRKVIHLLPYDGIGGAEAAARSMRGARSSDVAVEVRYVFPDVTSSSDRRATNNPLQVLRTAFGILRDAPDVLIVSLWRSCVVGVLVRLLRPKTRLVVLIHNSVDAQFLDFLFTRAAMALSHAVWSDSEASARLRFGRPPRKLTVIPFLTQKLAPASPPEDALPPTASFIFWGRLAAQKNLPRALELFDCVRRHHPDARFTIIGPDGGELRALRAICVRRNLVECVDFVGPLQFEDIVRRVPGHSFYLQTSTHEGMAMSVIEAMQLGLVPVVTAVGEIGTYCRTGHNAVIVDDVPPAAEEVRRLLTDPAEFGRRRHAAIAAWKDKPLYRDAFLAACVAEAKSAAEPCTPDHGR